MDSVTLFQQAAQKAADAFRTVPRDAMLRVISHIDTDGICAAAILVDMLNKDNRRYQLSILPTVDDRVLTDLAEEDNTHYVFTDFGSGQLNSIKGHLAGRRVFILDHHVPETDEIPATMTHLNPHALGISGSQDISGAGVVYYFAKALLGKSDLAHIAIVGAVGDTQDQGGFSALNRHILEDACSTGRMEVQRGFKFFGQQTRSLHKLLEYGTDIFIPGVTGSESGAIQFLRNLGIHPKIDNYWKRFHDLTPEEQQRLATGIILRRSKQANPEDIFTDLYILPDEDVNSPLREAKEFSTLLNACGRMDKASLGIGTCLGNRQVKQRALRTLADYKRKIMKALTWFQEAKDNPSAVQRHDHYMIINAQGQVMATIIGTMASILAKSGEYPDDYLIMSLARNEEGQTKISLRAAGRTGEHLNLQEIATRIIELVGSGQAGGHQYAAGAIIDTAVEEQFLKAARAVLEEVVREEVI